ncbi:caspase activity and apoptosis inhibitor 1 isoform X2 [Heptranchias perlo]|uniref:caspase activity and apoptosis inhibitor 1 isoform X2 n=1 Tax=Heptranchias perlo TaxID=212740 RepID=UPI0035597476
MAGKKSAKEKKRKRCHGEESHGERKRLNSDSSTNEAGRVASEKETTNEPSDLEEGGLDLSVGLKPISSYILDRKEMLEQCFRVIGERKLQKMLPDILKNCSVEEIKALCLEQLTLFSDKKLLQIIEGDDLGSSDTEEELGENDRHKKKLETESQITARLTDQDGQKCSAQNCLKIGNTLQTHPNRLHDGVKKESWCSQDPLLRQDNNIDSTSSYKEHTEQEAPELKQGGASGDESDALSINAEAYDSDIEQNCNEQEDSAVLVIQKSTTTRVGVEDEIQKDIEKSVNEILGLSGSTTGRHQSAGSSNPDGEGLQPSAQQLELLELEMRARAIKALMRAGDTKTQS